MSKENYCAHCGRPIYEENKEESVYEEMLMVKLFCEQCGKMTFIRWEDRKR